MTPPLAVKKRDPPAALVGAVLPKLAQVPSAEGPQDPSEGRDSPQEVGLAGPFPPDPQGVTFHHHRGVT